MRTKITLTVVLAALVAFTAPAIAKKTDGPNTGALPAGCVKIDSDMIGAVPVSASVDGVTVTIIGWTEKDDEPGEYIGFDYIVDGGSFDTVSVKSGQDISEMAATGGSWVNPNGTSGSGAKAISNIVFCGADQNGTGGGLPDEG